MTIYLIMDEWPGESQDFSEVIRIYLNKNKAKNGLEKLKKSDPYKYQYCKIESWRVIK